jgi:hypothetical protein
MAGRSMTRMNGARLKRVILPLAPFMVFYLTTMVSAIQPALIAGLAASLIVPMRDLALRRRVPKLMDVGTSLTFAGLLAYFAVIGHGWSVAMVRLTVHASLLRLAVFSMVIRRPFTRAYAREDVPQEHWGERGFVRRSYIVTGVWGLAFAAMVAADLAWMEIPSLPRGVASWSTMAAILGAVWFTAWDPEPLEEAAPSVSTG